MVESREPTKVDDGGGKVGGQQMWGSSRGPVGVGFFDLRYLNLK
jgi:hypothetical protein